MTFNTYPSVDLWETTTTHTFPNPGMSFNWVRNIREELALRFDQRNFVTDKTGVRMVEVVSASFVADEPLIFGAVNEEYVERELKWYASQSLNVYDIEGKVPAIWEAVSSKGGNLPKGTINSNYGWMIWSPDNGRQFENVVAELRKNPFSRRAVMIYTRPSIWEEYNIEGMSDFICTTDVQYVIRNGCLDAVVRMRSNDSWAGYRNDRAWQDFVLNSLLLELNAFRFEGDKLEKGWIYWNSGSQHVYEKDFYLIDHYNKTDETSITKAKYRELYPESEWC